jgi:hypothetical protein
MKQTTRIRVYVWLDTGPRRLPRQALDGTKYCYPQLASTRQKAVQAIYEFRGGRLYLAPLDGDYATFDADGAFYVSDEDLHAAGLLAKAHSAAEREKLKPVPNLAAVREWKSARAKYDADQRWRLSSDDKQLIIADLLGSERPRGAKAIPILKPVSRRLQAKRRTQPSVLHALHSRIIEAEPPQ